MPRHFTTLRSVYSVRPTQGGVLGVCCLYLLPLFPPPSSLLPRSSPLSSCKIFYFILFYFISLFTSLFFLSSSLFSSSCLFATTLLPSSFVSLPLSLPLPPPFLASLPLPSEHQRHIYDHMICIHLIPWYYEVYHPIHIINIVHV